MKECVTKPFEITPFVSRFYESEDEVLQEIQSIVESDPSCTKAELFRKLSMRKGKNKSHVSRYQADHYDGQRKD